jgi:hypothetical protein
MPLMFGNKEVITGLKGEHFPIAELKNSFPFQDQDPLIMILIIPEVFRTRVRARDNALDLHGI